MITSVVGLVCTTVVSPPDSTIKEGKGRVTLGHFLGLAGSGYVHQHGCASVRFWVCVGDSNLYSRQWPCYTPAVSESYDWAKL